MPGLRPKDRLFKGPLPELDLEDADEPSPQALRQLAEAAEDAARAVPGVTNSEGGSASCRARPVRARHQPRLYRRLWLDQPGPVAPASSPAKAAACSATMPGVRHATAPTCRRRPRSANARAPAPSAGSIPAGCRAGRCRWCSIRGSAARWSAICSARSRARRSPGAPASCSTGSTSSCSTAPSSSPTIRSAGAACARARSTARGSPVPRATWSSTGGSPAG